MAQFTKFDDILDVREIIERIEELEGERDDHILGAPDGTETPDPEGWAEENPSEAEELDALETLMAEMKGYGGDEQWRGDWYPLTLIRDSYFEDYAQELVQDIGDMPNGLPSYIVIDWEATARSIRMDYSSIDFDGVTYWYR